MFEVLNDAAVELSLGRLEVSEKGSLSTAVCLCFLRRKAFCRIYYTAVIFPLIAHPVTVSNLGVLLLGANACFV